MNNLILINDIQTIINIKNKINESNSVKSSIFSRHNIVDFKKNEFVFEKNTSKYNIISKGTLLFCIGGVMASFFCSSFILLLLFITGTLISVLADIFITVFNNNNSLLMTHEDYVDLSKILTKEEIKTLIEFYTQHGIKGRIDEHDYRFNLADLYEPFEAEYAVKPEILKVIKETRFDNYLESLY